jgi:hypothetical protein
MATGLEISREKSRSLQGNEELGSLGKHNECLGSRIF